MRVYKEVWHYFGSGRIVARFGGCSRCKFVGDDLRNTRGKHNNGKRLGLGESK